MDKFTKQYIPVASPAIRQHIVNIKLEHQKQLQEVLFGYLAVHKWRHFLKLTIKMEQLVLM